MIVITPLRNRVAVKRKYKSKVNAKRILGVNDDDPGYCTWGDVVRWDKQAKEATASLAS